MQMRFSRTQLSYFCAVLVKAIKSKGTSYAMAKMAVVTRGTL